jgi:lipocalin
MRQKIPESGIHTTQEYVNRSHHTSIILVKYCGNKFRLVQPDNDFAAGGATKTVQYRNKNTGEIVVENRAEGICLSCAKEIMRRQ